MILNRLRGVNELFRLMITSNTVKTLIQKSLKLMTIHLYSRMVHGIALKYLKGCHKLIFDGSFLIQDRDYFYLDDIDILEFRYKYSQSLNFDEKICKEHLELVNCAGINGSGFKNINKKTLKKLFLSNTLDNCYFKDLIGISTIKVLVDRSNIGEHLNVAHNIQCSSLKSYHFKFFKSVRKLISTQYSKHGDDCIKNLYENLYDQSSLKHLSIRNFDISDESMSYFKHLKTLNIDDNSRVTDQGIKNLQNITKISLSNCVNIHDESMQYLSNCHTVNVYYLPLTVVGYTHLSNVQNLIVGGSNFPNNTPLFHLFTNLQQLDIRNCVVHKNDVFYLKYLNRIKCNNTLPHNDQMYLLTNGVDIVDFRPRFFSHYV
ncbi:hypothetical protein DLAC_04238 [Tieghemostelium lacteum]|uniref:Uncharacterized protein n=1 Tax=Tieghemostelium lacteum TaxID=361077 RepID=A0A151ZSM9_TIELA|nr:hypothetical protein DLAC_04238 [Tieghemostelium lacteum]|eukprot:KYQ96918.1 hypothetical protein DLAC_04238 [Tieghemostelium lacteum]